MSRKGRKKEADHAVTLPVYIGEAKKAHRERKGKGKGEVGLRPLGYPGCRGHEKRKKKERA